MCETPISENEFSDLVNKLKINKSPGLDGLTPEFYKHFWHHLSTPFCNMGERVISEKNHFLKQ